ncbi:hypothetical protein ACFL2V_17775 [Pseudomonadota bacterium]
MKHGIKGFDRLVIDESVCAAQLTAFQKWQEKHHLRHQSLYFIAEHHPGMPDSRILQTVLSKQDAMLTSDRPFHNRLLKEGFSSFYIDERLTISQRALKGIRPAFLPAIHGNNEKQAEMSSIHNLIMPDSDRALKKLRTKRRRIRNHFGGYDQLTQLSITIARREQLNGVRLNVAGSSAKGIMASESYIDEPDRDSGTASLCHALVLPLQLMLQRLETSLFYDPATIPDPNTLDDPFFNRLKNEFPNIKFIACPKGRHIEALWEKLASLQSSKTNEIVPSHLTVFRESVMNRLEDVTHRHSESSML